MNFWLPKNKRHMELGLLKKVFPEVYMVNNAVPLLLRKAAMKRVKIILNFVNDTVYVISHKTEGKSQNEHTWK